MTEYIKREDALKFQDELEPCFCRSAITGEAFIATKDADLVPFLQNIPAEDVRHVPRGEWINRRDEYGPYFECPFCHRSWYVAARVADNFCPNCGADMRGGGGNE